MSGERKLQVVTGGTSGMGLSTAKALGAYGPVLIGGRSAKRLENAMAELKEAGVEVYGKSCDVSDPESLKAFVEYAISIAPVGNVVNAAGVDFDNASAELIAKINMQGTHYVLEAFLPYLDHSTVLNYSSITGYYYQAKKEDIEVWKNPDAEDFCEKALALIPEPTDPRVARLGSSYGAYTCSKRFVIWYTMANVVRVAKKNNSRIISVAPGSFMTPMLEGQAAYLDSIAKGTALGRVGQPEEMADLIAKLLSDGHEYLTGCDIIMDGGKFAFSTVEQFA